MAKINEFMTVSEAAVYIGASKTSLRRWDRAGTLRARRHPANQYRMYHKADLDRFLAELGVTEEPAPKSRGAKKKPSKRKRSR